ncbi:uncharacterized protein PG998_013566 [Apiospora kogelbergensis]|uniref:uncharacterized protein n=1 Tax=Apiospora kogelbergensis TaxID=1337665 RepID=UPI0031326C88
MEHTLPSSPPLYSGYHLEVRQEPERGKVALGKEKDKKPVDPPPIVELVVPQDQDRNRLFLQNPYLILIAFLESVPDAPSAKPSSKTPKDGGDRDSHETDPKTTRIIATVAFSSFPDLTVKKDGWFRIRFTLMTMEENRTENRIEDTGFDGSWITICNIHSKPFQVHTARTFPGMSESTFMTRSFSDQGVRIRLRKDSRQVTVKKRNHDVARHLKGDIQEEGAYEGMIADSGSAKRQRTSTTGYNNPSPTPISTATTYPSFAPTLHTTAPPYSIGHGGITSSPTYATHNASHMGNPMQVAFRDGQQSMGPPGPQRVQPMYNNGPLTPQFSGGRSPNISPYGFGNFAGQPQFSPQNASFNFTVPSPSHGLPPMDTSSQQGLQSSSPHNSNTSPRVPGIPNDTPTSSTGSPIDNAYSISGGSGYPGSGSQQPSYATDSNFMSHYSNAGVADNDTRHGIPGMRTPLGTSLPESSPFNGSGFAGHLADHKYSQGA